MDKFLNKIKLIQANNVLDVATGRGEFIPLLKENLRNYNKIIGIDTNQKMLEKARKKFENDSVFFKQLPAENTEFSDDYFDVVAISNSLHHMKKLQAVLDEMYRILKPEGYFLINEMIRDDEQTPAQENHIAIHHWAAAIDIKRGRFHGKTFTRKQIEEILNRSRLDNIDVYEYSHKIDNPLDEQIVRDLTRKIDQYIQILEDEVDCKKLIERGEVIKENVKRVGFASAKSVFIIAKK